MTESSESVLAGTKRPPFRMVIKAVKGNLRYLHLELAVLSCMPHCHQLYTVCREVKVTESSESVLAGTKRPPFRMVVRAVKGNGSRLNIRPAVSEEFVVVTKRTKNLKKQEIPSLDDPISKLNHIGKETVKKLNEIKASADEMSLDLKLPRELWR